MSHFNDYVVGCLGIDSSSLQINSNFSQAPGANLSFSCVHNPSIQITVVCQDDGRWEPNPQSFSLLCNIKDLDNSESCILSTVHAWIYFLRISLKHAEISQTTEMIPIANMTNGTVADNSETFAGSLYKDMYRYVIISAHASASIIAGFSVIIVVVICIYQIRKRRRQALCRNLERHYETVDEPIYETILNNNYSKSEEWSDFNTNCNEAYQKVSTDYHN